MAVYTRRFFSGRALPAGGVYVTPPTGKRWIIRNFIAFAEGSTEADMAVYAPDPVIAFAVTRSASPLLTIYGLETRVVIEPGENIRILNINGQWDVTITGYEFSLP